MRKKTIKAGRPGLGKKYPKSLIIPASEYMIAYVKLMGRSQDPQVSGAEWCRRMLFPDGWKAELAAMGGDVE
jgi:hypothetical protein